MKSGKHALLVGFILIVVAAFSRFMPHWHNFTAVGGAGLFGAYFFRNRIWAFILPLVAMWLSDLILNNIIYAAYYEGFVWFNETMIWVYVGFIALVAVGRVTIRSISIKNIVVGALAGSLVFFLISNFGSFVQNPVYPKSIGGLLMAYGAGLPFFLNTVLANVFFAGIFFGSYAASPKLLLARESA